MKKSYKIIILLSLVTLLASCNHTTNTIDDDKDTDDTAIQNEINVAIDDISSNEEVTSDQTGTNVIKLVQKYSFPNDKGEAEVEFALSMAGDSIESVSIVNTAGELSPSQKNFSENVNSVVVGMSIEEAKEVGTIGGSSLTTGAFKAAIKNL